MTDHKTGTPEEWRAARLELLKAEKELTRRRDELARRAVVPPLVATIMIEDPLRTDGSMYCHTFFEIADGSVLAFFEHTSLFHPKNFTARSGFHRSVALEVEGARHHPRLALQCVTVGKARGQGRTLIRTYIAQCIDESCGGSQ
jgi:Bacterial protein of unknown function (DUF899)